MMKFMLSILCLFSFVFAVSAQTALEKRIATLRSRTESGNTSVAANANYELAKLAKEHKLHRDPVVCEAEYKELIARAADLGHARAKLDLAKYYLGSKTLKNQQLAFPYLMDLAKIHPSKNFTLDEKLTAFYLLGSCYETGRGTHVDALRAQRFYRLASMGNTDAQFVVMRAFNKDKKMEAVFEILYKLCLEDQENGGNGKQIDSFLGQNKLRDRFAEYLDRKSTAGDRIATIILAENFFSGGMFPQQRKKGLMYFQRAAEQGNSAAAMKLADLHEKGMFGLAKDQEIIRKYYLLAFQDSKFKKNASSHLADMAKNHLKQLEAAGKTSVPEYSKMKDGYFFFLMCADRYADARTFVNSEAGQQFQEKDLYLKAMEYCAASGKTKQYKERLRMASNAGYPLAVIDYLFLIGENYRTPKQSSTLLKAMLYYPKIENPEWLWTISKLYREGGKENPDFSYEKSLEYAIRAANRGCMDALEYLVRSYQEGNRLTNIPADPAKSASYRKLLLQKDLRFEKNAFFEEYMAELMKKKTRTPGDFSLVFRSLVLSPFADYAYSTFLFKGDKSMGIEKDDEHAMLVLHFSAQGANFNRAVQEIIRRIQAGVKPNRTPDEVLQDQETISYYKSLL